MSNLDILHEIYSNGDALPGYLHPQFKLHAPGQNSVGGEFEGLDGMMTHLGSMHALSNGTMKLDPHSYFADDNWGMVISHITAERDGKKLDVQGFGLWRFEDGKLTDHWEYADNAAVWDDFWS